jgi:hypothetical protein
MVVGIFGFTKFFSLIHCDIGKMDKILFGITVLRKFTDADTTGCGDGVTVEHH